MVQRNRAPGRRSTAGSSQGTARGDRGDRDTGAARDDRPRGNELAAHRTRLHAVILPIVESAGYDLEDLSVARAGRRHLLRVTVDGDSGVSLDTVADLSRAISAALDGAESAGGEFTTTEYVLEVSSPGVDRPLTAPRHFRRNIGRLIQVRAGERQVTGRIEAAGERTVTLDVAGRAHEYGYADLGPARVQIEFSRPDDVADDELAEFEDPGGTDGHSDSDDEADFEEGGDER